MIFLFYSFFFFLPHLLLGAPPSLDTWLSAHPPIAQAIVWDEKGNRRTWPTWPDNDHKRLTALFDSYCQEQPTAEEKNENLDAFPNQKPLGDLDFPETVFSEGVAKRRYFTSIAHSLALEICGKVGWSFLNYTPAELEILFDSRTFFEWDGSQKGYRINEDQSGLISPSPPLPVYHFLRTNHIIGMTRGETLLRLLRWCSGLTHDVASESSIKAGYYRETARFQDSFWHYRGFPPVMRVLLGTEQNLVPDPRVSGARHWTAGCWGTTGLIREVLRTINIPVQLRRVDGHSLPFFPSENVFLSHGDDPYNRLFTSLPSPLPYSALLVPASRWDHFFGSGGPRNNKVGCRPVELAIERLPGEWLSIHCSDRRQHVPSAQSEIVKEIGDCFTHEELAGNKFWERLDEAVKKRGCPQR